jgi:GNAT superfamily N-acetyltransferase
MEPSLDIEPLEPYHEVADFDCGVRVLNAYLIERAHADQRVGQARVFVALRGDFVVAYCSLMAASVRRQQTRAEALAGERQQAVSAVLLSRLAVDLDEQGHGLGERMLLESLARAGQAAEAIDARVVPVHAKSEAARSFYEHYGLQRSPIGPLHLMLPIEDVRKTFAG